METQSLHVVMFQDDKTSNPVVKKKKSSSEGHHFQHEKRWRTPDVDYKMQYCAEERGIRILRASAFGATESRLSDTET